MEYSKIIAITGLPGLFELISSKSDGGIVRSLEDKSTRFVSSRVHQFSHLESIEVYTTKHNVNLVDVLKAMEGSKEKLPDDKDAGLLRSYFEKVYPELDFDRVYSSDLKKMVKWYAVLAKNQVEIKLSEPAEEEPEQEIIQKDTPEEKPAKKATASKTEAKTEEKPKSEKKPAKKAAEEKPVKKESTKKEETKPAKKSANKKSTPDKGEKESTGKPTAKKTGTKKK
jgi:flagellar biosynthesis GTPase FlhF